MLYIYILKCKNNKYYIGKTHNPNTRINNHIFNYGSAWTAKFKPIKILKIINNCDLFDEDKYTIMIMDKYGIDNVRGGSFTQLVLSKSEKYIICKMIRSANNQCFNCGSATHFISNCVYNTFNIANKILYDNIIRLCNGHNIICRKINIGDYVNILHICDDIIFNAVTIDDINKFNSSNNDIIDYYQLTNKLVNALNKIK
jgi:hypothetical protein